MGGTTGPGSQFFVPLTGRLLAGCVPPRQGELLRVTVRDWLPVSPLQILAGLSPVQGPVFHSQVGRQFLVPLTVCVDCGAVPPSHGLLIKVTVRDWLPVLSWQILAGLSPVQGPVDQRQVGREQSIVPDTVRLAGGRVPPTQGRLVGVTVRDWVPLLPRQILAASGPVQEPAWYWQVGGGQCLVP